MASPHAAGFGLLHEIFVLDAHLQDELDITKRDSITKNLIETLLKALHMEELGPLNIYPAVDDRAPGWSFIQPITTSHISGHYFEKPGRDPNIRMDFYSCKSVNWMKIIDICHEHLKLADWRATFIDRQIEPGSQRRVLELNGQADQVIKEITMEPAETLQTVQRVKQKHLKKVSA